MNLMLKKYIRNIGLVWLGCFVLFLIVYILLLAPQRKSINASVLKLDEVKSEYEKIVKYSQASSIDNSKKEVSDLKSKLARYSVDFMNSSNLTLDISKIARNKNLVSFVIGAGTSEGPRKASDIERITENNVVVDYKVNNFSQFATFLNTLERHNPVVFVDGFKITRSDKDGQGHEVSMNLSYFVEKPEIK
jgi:hypothetical protein